MFRRRQRYADPAATPRGDEGYAGPAGPPRAAGPARALTTLLGAGVAGLLIWFATQLNHHHESGYWGIVGLMAAAGLVMALSQLLGGWTKWGVPRISASVFLFAFVPVAIVALWVILAGEPRAAWFHNHVMAWTRDIHVSGLVTDMLTYIPVLAFGAGLVFGFTFDTTGPLRRRRAVATPATATAPARETTARGDGRAADEPVTAERRAQADTDAAPGTFDGQPVERTTTTTRTTNR